MYDAICSLRLQLSISEKLTVTHLLEGVAGKVHLQVNMEETSTCEHLVMVLPLARLLARHGTALMNNAQGHLPLLNYRSVEAQHMGTAQQVLMANPP